jgi:hypothetical protein
MRSVLLTKYSDNQVKLDGRGMYGREYRCMLGCGEKTCRKEVTCKT